MYCTYEELTWGIEIEFTRISRADASKLVAEFFNTTAKYRGGNLEHYEIIDPYGRIWKIVRDASIRPEMRDGRSTIPSNDYFQCELVSPIMNKDGPTTAEDIDTLQRLIRKLRKEGKAGLNSSCGIHIHVGVENFSPYQLLMLCNIVYAKQDLIERALLIHDYRKTYCQPLPLDFIEKINSKKPKTNITLENLADAWYGGPDAWNNNRNLRYHQSRYRLLNFHQLFSGKHKTAEFRCFNSYLHAGKIKAYIQFCLLLVSQVSKQNRASYKKTQVANGNYKYTFRVWLLKLGATTPEFKTMRHHLLNNLEGNAAWKNRHEEFPF